MSETADKKQRTHEAILASCKRLLRTRGITRSSVMDVMKGAGLTVGGFYAHFDSKEALFAETISHAAREMWDQLILRSQSGGVASAITAYLSRAHRDHPEAGCLLPSVAADVATSGEPYRSALIAELERFVHALGPLLPTAEGRLRRREQSLALLALLYGGLALARATAGTPFSDEVLRAARALALRTFSPT